MALVGFILLALALSSAGILASAFSSPGAGVVGWVFIPLVPFPGLFAAVGLALLRAALNQGSNGRIAKIPPAADAAFGLFCLALVFGPLIWLYVFLHPGLFPEADSRSSYYRITTDLLDDGKPLQLDVVVQCKGPFGTQTPYLYGRPTAGDGAVLMRVPNFCHLFGDDLPPEQLKEREQLKANLSLPLIFFSSSRTDLSQLTAYTSLSGFKTEGSHLDYVASRFSDATYADWLAWKKQSGTPFVTRANDPFNKWEGDEGPLSWSDVGRTTRGVMCFALMAYPIPPKYSSEVMAAWPSKKPLVWADRDLHRRILPEAITAFDPTRRYRPDVVRDWIFGRGNDGRIPDLIPYRADTVLRSDEPLAAGMSGQSRWVTIRHVDLDTRRRGQADCFKSTIIYPDVINLITRNNRTQIIIDHGELFVDKDLMLDFVHSGNIVF